MKLLFELKYGWSRASHPEQSLERKQAQPAEPTTPEKHMTADRENLTAWQ
jgi:hypothetical protein